MVKCNFEMVNSYLNGTKVFHKVMLNKNLRINDTDFARFMEVISVYDQQ